MALVSVAVTVGLGCASTYSVGESSAPPQDASSGITVGDRGGACYPNSTCNAGLTCVAGECELVIDGAVQPIDASGTSDAAVATRTDAATPVDGGPCTSPIVALAANDCANGRLKCLAEQVCYDTPDQCITEESDRGVSCNTSANCGPGTVCCATLPNVDLTTCPIKARPQADSSISTTCRATCLSMEYQVCTGLSECGLKKCTPAKAPGAFLTGQIVSFAVCL